MATFDQMLALKALSEESRLRLLRLLLLREHSVTELSETLNLTTYNTSKHLRILKDAGLITSRKLAQQRFYNLTEEFQSRLDSEKNTLDLGCCVFRFDRIL